MKIKQKLYIRIYVHTFIQNGAMFVGQAMCVNGGLEESSLRKNPLDTRHWTAIATLWLVSQCAASGQKHRATPCGQKKKKIDE